MSNPALTDKHVLRRQYADDRNLRARQRLWEISRSEPGLDLHAWSVDLIDAHDGDTVLDAGCGNGRPLALLRERNLIAVGIDQSPGMVQGANHPRPSTTAFNLESGAAVLATAFASVEIVHAPDQRISITDPDALADYVASSGDHFSHTLPTGRTWPDIVENVRTTATQTITTKGALTVTSKLGAFICQ